MPFVFRTVLVSILYCIFYSLLSHILIISSLIPSFPKLLYFLHLFSSSGSFHFSILYLCFDSTSRLDVYFLFSVFRKILHYCFSTVCNRTDFWFPLVFILIFSSYCSFCLLQFSFLLYFLHIFPIFTFFLVYSLVFLSIMSSASFGYFCSAGLSCCLNHMFTYNLSYLAQYLFVYRYSVPAKGKSFSFLVFPEKKVLFIKSFAWSQMQNSTIKHNF